MKSLLKIFELLEIGGFRIEPVVGTKWYKVFAPDGHYILIKESVLKSLGAKGESTHFEEYLKKQGCASG